MMHFILPPTQNGIIAAAIAIPVVCLFIWFFNSCQMGKFKKIKPISNPKYATFIIFAFIIIAVVLISLFMFK
ncbi:MAG: hypothetical protein IKA10_08950 [Oscillospiraceae bacterium]|nr:hypothetical protein [Oscillospiraceae bacterium]